MLRWGVGKINGVGHIRAWSGAGLPIPTSLAMSSRLNLMGLNGYVGSNGTDTDSNTRLSLFNQTGTGVTKVILYFPNWYCNATNEVAGYNSITITASIEYPAGTFQQVTFNGGSTSAALAVDALQASDEITLNATIPSGTQFWIRTYVSVTAANKWVQGYLIYTWLGELADFSTGVDKTMSGTITNATPTANRRGYGPIGMKATGFSGTPVKRAFASVGDSILAYAGDGNHDTVGNQGWNGRGLTGRFPHNCYAISGQSAANNKAANFTRRQAALLASGVTDILCNYANNDLGSTDTYATITSNITSIVSNLISLGLRVHYCTPLPKVTGTYLTAAGQTVSVPNGGYLPEGGSNRYSQVADWIRGNSIGLSGVVEIQDTVAVNSSNILTRNAGYWLSGNGGVGSTNSHLTTSGAATDAATSDGQHPNLTNTGSQYGGHYILRDTFITYLTALPS